MFFSGLGSDPSTRAGNKLTDALSFFEDRFFDLRTKHTIQKGQLDKRIVLLDIDDQSLQGIGRWPWSRQVWAKVMEKLDHFDPKVVVFDAFFSEPEESSSKINPDRLFANAIKNFQSAPGKDRSVILSYFLTRDDNPNDNFREENFPEDLLPNALSTDL